MKYYTIHHHTRYRYESDVRESTMEVRMQPRTDRQQRCLNFRLEVWPHAQVLATSDCMQNAIHYFDIPRSHSELLLRAQTLVMVQESEPLPESLDATEWNELEEIAASGQHWDWLTPSSFARPTSMLSDFAEEIGFGQDRDPLTAISKLNERIHSAIEYTPMSTAVDSPIDTALEKRSGVCQDYSHIMIALLRRATIPARYISGYVYLDPEKKREKDISGASHAWVEAFLPATGWIGFDPTNNTLVSDKHIRIAVGRDYADVPPTRGTYKGNARSELTVGVHISETEDEDIPHDLLDNGHITTREFVEAESSTRLRLEQEQQQQQ
ncbi:MAG: transglutaminase family protein [Caldilineaceae bacterium]|nr:transglutaminase family protein [Caldilineaceae bacterium]